MPKRVNYRNTRFIKTHGTNKPKNEIKPSVDKVQIKSKRKQSRLERPVSGQNVNMFTQVTRMLNEKSHFYLGFGGTGDALLLFASCWDDHKARVFFFANNGSIPLITQFCKLFKLSTFLHPNIMGQTVAGEVFTLLTKHHNFKTSAHLADGLYFGDWVNEDKYIKRIKKYVPWVDFFGAAADRNYAVVCPAGSDRNKGRQRFITNKENGKLLNKLLETYNFVYCIGADTDYRHYNKLMPSKSAWISSNKINERTPTNLLNLLKIINGAKTVISVDTWLKTYSLLAGIPTKVIRTRWNGQYRPYGVDVNDFVFINKKIWENLELVTLEDLL